MSKTTKPNTIIVSINCRNSEYHLSIRKLLEAARHYKQRAWTPSDTLFVNGRKIELEDIFELNMPGRLDLARRIVEDLFFEEEVTA